MDIKELLDKARDYLPDKKLALIEGAFQFALERYRNEDGRSAELRSEHPLDTASIVVELHLDADCVAATLLHDVPGDHQTVLVQIGQAFGAEVAKLVDGMVKLRSVEGKFKPEDREETEVRSEGLWKMLVAMPEDFRVVLIKLADQLHHMRALKASSPSKKRHLAQETMEIYAPLAHRLGMGQLEWQLEDLSFRYLEPEKYRQIVRLVAAKRMARERHIAQVTRILRDEFEKAGLKAEVTGRPKHIYSIYNKMGKYAAQGREFSEIHDLLALRVLVDEVQDCYSALGIIHGLWRPISDQFDDFIASPKENMYQSLHTTVMGLGARPLEIQIRTHDMHRIAEYGIAAHWRYKEGARKTAHFEDRMSWLRQLMEWQRELSGADLLESVKADVFRDQVLVYTPKGEVKELPTGSTPLDFAYHIHTDLGHRCIGAKVNGKLVSLNYQLQNGDTVEILSTKTERGPSRDWLIAEQGYVTTAHSKEKIRQWFRRQERAENVERGRELLEKTLRRLGMRLDEQEEVSRLFKYDGLEEFLAALGCGDISAHQVAMKIADQQEPPPSLPEVAPSKAAISPSVQVLGVGDLLTNVARCCNPVPGDEIIGFVTRTKGVTVHRKDCPNIANEDEKERLISVKWGQYGKQLYPVSVQLEVLDRVGLLRDVSTMVSAEKMNIVSVNSKEREDGTVSVFLTLEVTGTGQLNRILSKLEGVRGVISATKRAEAP